MVTIILEHCYITKKPTTLTEVELIYWCMFGKFFVIEHNIFYNIAHNIISYY